MKISLKLPSICQLLLLAVVVTLSNPLLAQVPGVNRADSLYIRGNYVKTEVMVPMRDGVKLFTSIYVPKNTSQKYPIMFDRTPYSAGTLRSRRV